MMRSITSTAVFCLAAAVAGIVVTPGWAEAGGPKDPKATPTPFVEVGPAIHLYSGIQLNPCQCTTVTGYGMREVRVALLLVRDGDQTVVEERSYKWDAWPVKPPPPGGKPDPADVRVQGVLQVQLLKGETRDRFSVAFGAGFEGEAMWTHVHKPREAVLETSLATTHYTSLRGYKEAGDVHVASIYALHGADQGELGEVKSVADLKRKSKDHKGTTYLVTTLSWVAGK